MNRITFNLQRNAILYTRVSTTRQGIAGVSLDAQEQSLRAYCDGKGWGVDRIYRDVVSGSGDIKIRRPQLRDALQRAEDLQIPILVTSLDRLSRNTETIEYLSRTHKVEIISIGGGSGSDDEVVVGALGKQAQHVREEISRRTKEGLQQRKAAGVLLGNRTNLPEAAKKGHAAVSAKAEARAEKLRPIIDDIIASGTNSINGIARELEARGISTDRGGKWQATTVRNVLKRLGRLDVPSHHGSDRGADEPARPDADLPRTSDHPDFGSW